MAGDAERVTVIHMDTFSQLPVREQLSIATVGRGKSQHIRIERRLADGKLCAGPQNAKWIEINVAGVPGLYTGCK